MLKKDLSHCRAFRALDDTMIRELMHPPDTGKMIACSLAHATLEPGRSSRRHRLRTSSEIYYILEGRGRMHIDEECDEVSPGQAIFIPPGAAQFIENTGAEELKFLCVVDPAWQEMDEELL